MDAMQVHTEVVTVHANRKHEQSTPNYLILSVQRQLPPLFLKPLHSLAREIRGIFHG